MNWAAPHVFRLYAKNGAQVPDESILMGKNQVLISK
jgi:hypothetical protein